MAQELITRVWCDRCLSKGEHTEGVTIGPIAIGRTLPRLLDLCAQCQADVFAPLAELLDAEGRSADSGRRRYKNKQPTAEAAVVGNTGSSDEPVVCPDCGGTFKSTRGLGNHRRTMHPAEDQLELESEPEAGEHVCPDCGKSFERTQGLGAHRARSHGYRAGDDDA